MNSSSVITFEKIALYGLPLWLCAVLISSCEATLERKSQQLLLNIVNDDNKYSFCSSHDCFEPTTKVAFDNAEREAPSLVIYFEKSSSKLEKDHKVKLQRSISLFTNRALSLHGYTDNTGSWSINSKLARKRALEVRSYLLLNGVYEALISIDSHPMCCYMNTNNSEEGRRENRRVEIYIN